MLTLNVHTRDLIDSSRLSLGQKLGVLWRLQRYALPLWDKILLRVCSTFVLSVLATVPPLLTPYVIDDALPNGDLGLLVRVAFLSIAVAVVTRTLGLISGTERVDSSAIPTNIVSAYMQASVAVRIREDFLHHVQRLSMGFFSTRPVGEHMFRSTSDCDDSAFLAAELIPKSIAAVQRMLVLLLVLQGFGAWLLVPVGIYLCFFLASKHALSSAVRRWDRRYRVETQRLEATCRETLFPWKLVKAYTMESLVQYWYGCQAARSARASFMRGLLVQFDSYFTFVAIQVFISVLNVATGWYVVSGTLTLGEYAAIGGLVAMLVKPFEEIISTFQLFRQKLVPAERLLETMALAPDVADPSVPRPTFLVQGTVELREVSFAYVEGHEVLHGVSLVAHRGEKVAIVGPAGGGKSTILNLIVRLHDVARGQVLVDGTDVRDVGQEQLRGPLGYVPQSIITFTESVLQNIRYGNPRSTDAEVLHAASLARVDEFVVDLPEGFQTKLGEGGALSGGQKQRLCLARALVRNPRVLLLDEATSALDPATEEKVVEAIDREFGDRTRIVVAHNLLNARTADRIYVVDEGRIVETGTHEELMRANGRYVSLWRSNT